MVVEVGVGNSNPVGGVGDVNQTVVVVLVDAQVAADVQVVEPHVGGLLNGDAVAAHHLAQNQVAHDDVLDALDREVDARDGCQMLVSER